MPHDREASHSIAIMVTHVGVNMRMGVGVDMSAMGKYTFVAVRTAHMTQSLGGPWAKQPMEM